MTWWRRNRIWLILLLPAMALALAASSFRLTNLYLPFQWSAPITADGPAGTLTQDYLGRDDQMRTRRVDVEVLSVESVAELDGSSPIPGANLWRVDLGFEADPEEMLADLCMVQLGGEDGTWYSTVGGRVAADPDDPLYTAPPRNQRCVPLDTPGPDLDALGEPVPAEVPRPERWEITTSMVVPDDVVPATVRIGWKQPEYLVLSVP